MCTEKFGVSGGVIREVLMGKRKGRYGDGSVFQRKSDGRWCGKLTITDPATGRKKNKVFYGETEAEAERKLREYKMNPLNRSKEFVSDADAANYIVDWLKNVKKREVKDSTYDRLERSVRLAVPAFSNLRLKDVTDLTCAKLLDDLEEEGYSYSTVKKVYDVMKSCFKYAVQRGDLLRNPMETVKMLPAEMFETEAGEEEDRHLTVEEEQAFLKEIHRVYKTGKYVYRYHAAFELMLNTGMRMGEIVAIDLKNTNNDGKPDIDFGKKVINISKTAALVKKRDKDGNAIGGQEQVIHSPKTKKSKRTVPLNKKALAALEELRDQAGDSPYLLPTQNGKRVVLNSIEKSCAIALRKVCEHKQPSSHWLRHTFATRLFEKGADVKAVSTLLGHASVAFTYNVYVHVIEQRKVDTVSLLDDSEGSVENNPSP